MSSTTLLSVPASHLARLHSILSFTAFIGALIIASSLHYTKIVKNAVAGWPEEWFPSVSATIGDWYPERSIFQILIALTSGPRFALIGFGYLLNRQAFPSSALPSFVLATGVLRTLCCGGWVYITSSDDHDVHDFLMILYIVLNLPWMLGNIRLSKGKMRRRRIRIASLFWVTLFPMIYFFVQHKVHQIPGAYTHYAFFEWSLILFDVLYDSVTILDFENNELAVSFNVCVDYRNRQTSESSEIDKNSAGEPSALTLSEGEKSPQVLNRAEAHPEAHSPHINEFSICSRASLSFLSDLYFAYQSWTLLTSLPVTLFYFSIWKLALAGPEFSSLIALSPLLLGFTPVLSFATSRGGRTILAGAAGVIGIGLWWAESMWVRLGAAMFGVFCTAIRWAGEWQSDVDRGYHAVLFLHGLILSSLSKHLNHGNNPAWLIVDSASGGQHVLILILGFLALIEFGTRPDYPFPASLTSAIPVEKTLHDGARKKDPKAPKRSLSAFMFFSLDWRERIKAENPGASFGEIGKLLAAKWKELDDEEKKPYIEQAALDKSRVEHSSTKVDSRRTLPDRDQWLLPSIALGSLIYSLHERLSDPSSLLAWSWSGFPTSGPHPHVHAPFTLLAQALSASLTLALFPSGSPTSSARFPNIFAHPLVFMIGVFSTYLLHTRTGWVGYTGGLLHTAFLTLITPPVLQNAGAAARACGAGRVFGTAWAVWIIFIFVGTFTVAYAFVPGTWSFRERTDLVLVAQLTLLAPFFNWRSSFISSPAPLPPIPHLARRYIRTTLALIAVVALIGPLRRSAPAAPTPVPAHARARILNAGIWAVHFGIDNAGRDSQHSMRDLFRDMDLDVVGLLETDLHRPVFGSRDLTRVAVEDLGYYLDIGPGPNKHTWGAVLLSKFPILRSRHHLLPSPDGELAPAIEAVIDAYGVNVTVIVAHNGQEETPLDRELQATELARIMSASYPDPLIFLGYVVTDPHAKRPAPYEIMVTDGRVHDIDKDDMDRWCEYIFYRGLHRTAYARVSRGSVTDTELQVGQFAVPSSYVGTTAGEEGEEVPEADRYLRGWKEDLPKEHWFPDAYYGNEDSGGVRGHYYHVFDTPLYYRLPPTASAPISTSDP